MKIIVLADNFTPEIAATSFRTHEHARVWLAAGHEVTVVTCAPNWPHGKVFDGYKNRFYQEESIDGIRVIRLWSYMSANAGFFKRSLDYASFMMSIILWSWRLPKFDIVLATSPQFFTAVAGWAISLLRRKPWVFEVRDLWPASIEAVGAARGRWIGWLERLELFLYRRADRIVALTDAFKANMVGRGIDGDKVDVVTNGVDTDQFGPHRVTLDARHELGVSAEQFVVGYVGTTGMAHGLETIVDAAKQCADDPSIRFVILGDGAHRKRLERYAEGASVTNLIFVDRVAHELMPSYVDAFDLPIIHLRKDPTFRTVIPSKLFEMMAMGQPVLMAVEGQAAKIVRDARCGLCIESSNPAAMADAIKHAAANRMHLSAMGARGQQVVVREYNRQAKASELLQTFAHVLGIQLTDREPQTRSAITTEKAA